uniref:Uncharacterized protein n=1 Tax=Hyaloperonospora arabidopsidis (strain Emoy2) TaxID=559515 RepID=M4B4W1_HYAAE
MEQESNRNYWGLATFNEETRQTAEYCATIRWIHNSGGIFFMRIRSFMVFLERDGIHCECTRSFGSQETTVSLRFRTSQRVADCSVTADTSQYLGSSQRTHGVPGHEPDSSCRKLQCCGNAKEASDNIFRSCPRLHIFLAHCARR